MRDTNSRSRLMRRVTILLRPLLLAFSVVACDGGPTKPSDADRIAVYTGKWRGNINAFEVILDVQARVTLEYSFILLDGTGTARNPATGEMHPLTTSGLGEWGLEYEQGTAFLNIDITPERPAGLRQHTGQFRGDVSPDGRTWPGRFSSSRPNTFGDLPIFGPGEHSATLIKE